MAGRSIGIKTQFRGSSIIYTKLTFFDNRVLDYEKKFWIYAIYNTGVHSLANKYLTPKLGQMWLLFFLFIEIADDTEMQ